MQFPNEIQAIINQYAKPASATLRTDWRKGSSIIGILTRDQWWEDYIYSFGHLHNDESWHDWCADKLIIGPPRYRSDRELTGYNEEYMSDHDIQRHYIPWVHTWPRPGDHSWCKVRGVPDWAKQDYIASKL